MSSVYAVANVLIGEADKARRPITPLQLIKLSYISYGFHLGMGLGRLFDEEIQAWRYGPVIPALYHKTKIYGRAPIPRKIGYGGPSLDGETVGFVESAYEAYGEYSGMQLSYLTHKEGTPWQKVYEPGIRGIVIPDAVIEAYYKTLIPDS